MTATPVHPAPAMARISPAQWLPLVDGLTDALRSERQLIDELIAIMRRQRESVAADDLQGVDDSVFAVQRVLLTLAEARKRRRALNVRFGLEENATLRLLLESMGPHATDELRASRESLQHSASALAREVSTNRQVLREALATGEDMVRTLAGAVAPPLGYGDMGRSAEPPHASYLVNRQA